MPAGGGWRRVFTAILADGITLDADPAVLGAWAERFSALDPQGRRVVLGELMDKHPGYATGAAHPRRAGRDPRARHTPAKHLAWPDLGCDSGCGCEQQAQFPPVSLPDPATLAKQVATDGADLLRRLAALATWAGHEGKTVDGRGDIRKADRPAVLTALGLPGDLDQSREIPALTRLWRLAIEFDVIQLRRTRVVTGAGARLVADALAGVGMPDQTLALWMDLADALIHPPESPAMPKGGDHLRDWLRPWMPRFLGILYTATATATAAGEPADLEHLTRQLLDEYAHRLPPGDPDLFAGLAAAAVRNTLSDLVDHGAVTVDVTGLDAGMELLTLAEAMARPGALGLGSAIVNVIALRLVRVDEVPGWVQVRIRWWSAHNTTFLVISAAVMAIGLVVLSTTAH